jgi:hypothetical protein
MTFVVGGRSKGRPIVEIRPAIPAAIPCVCLDVGPQFLRLAGARARKAIVPMANGQVLEQAQVLAQEPGQPNALPLALVADEVHPIVPVARSHERQPVPAKTQPVLDARTVSVRVAVSAKAEADRSRPPRQGSIPGLRQRGPVRRAPPYRPSSARTGRSRMATRDNRRTSEIALPARREGATSAARHPRGIAAPHSAAGARALARGPSRGGPSSPVVDRGSRRRPPTGAAATPIPAGELVDEPAVCEHVERAVGCLDIHGSKHAVPVRPDLFESPPRTGRTPKT